MAFDHMDTEDRYRLAAGSLEALTQLVEHQRPHEGPDCAALAPLLRSVAELVKWALPDGKPLHPFGVNDRD